MRREIDRRLDGTLEVQNGGNASIGGAIRLAGNGGAGSLNINTGGTVVVDGNIGETLLNGGSGKRKQAASS